MNRPPEIGLGLWAADSSFCRYAHLLTLSRFDPPFLLTAQQFHGLQKVVSGSSSWQELLEVQTTGVVSLPSHQTLTA